LVEVLAQNLIAGFSVYVDGLGTFYVTLSSKAVAEGEFKLGNLGNLGTVTLRHSYGDTLGTCVPIRGC
jgi:hypothetical protein